MNEKNSGIMDLCLSAAFSSTTALAQETESYTEGAGISVEVPGSHLLTIIVTGNADVTLDGQEGTVSSGFIHPLILQTVLMASRRISVVFLLLYQGLILPFVCFSKSYKSLQKFLHH